MSGVGLFTPRVGGFRGAFSLESKQVMSCALGVGEVYTTLHYIWGYLLSTGSMSLLFYKLDFGYIF